MKLIELSLRDGIQSEKHTLSVPQKLSIIKEIRRCGFERFEIGSLAHKRLVPAMANSFELISAMDTCLGGMLLVIDPFIFYQEVQNIASKIGWISCVVGSTEKFNYDNLRSETAKINKKNHEIILNCKDFGMNSRAYISVAFEDHDATLRLIELYNKLDVDEIVLGETTGRQSLSNISSLLTKVAAISTDKITLHFHNTYGHGLLAVRRALELGYENFDCTIGGLGGCPFVKNSAGNIAAEEIIFAFNLQYDLEKVVSIASSYRKLGMKTFSHIDSENYDKSN